MGRKRIKIDLIQDQRLRKITQCKRKRGIVKKAMELSLLCGNDILLIIHDQLSCRTLIYNTLPNYELFTDIVQKKGFTSSYSNADVLFLNYISISSCLEKRGIAIRSCLYFQRRQRDKGRSG